MTKYSVGQVIYVLLKKENRIFPMQIVEEITNKTLEGTVTNFLVRGGTDSETKMTVDEIDGEIFYTAAKMKETLLARATAAVDNLVSAASKKSSEWYPNSFEAGGEDDTLSLIKKIPTATPVPQKPPRVKKTNNDVEELKAEMAAEAEAGNIITLPDGRQAKVRSVKLPDSMS